MPILKRLKNMVSGDNRRGSDQGSKQARTKQQVASLGGSSSGSAPVITQTKSSQKESHKAKEAASSQREKHLSWGSAISNGLATIAEASEILAPLKAACSVTMNLLEIVQVSAFWHRGRTGLSICE